MLAGQAIVLNRTITLQILNRDLENLQKVGVINKNPRKEVTKARIRRQNRLYLCLESKIVKNYKLGLKKWKKVLRCCGSAWANYGKIVESRNM